MNKVPLVCLLTDFGLTDHYVGVMKAVIFSAAPGTQVIDLTHQVPPQDIRFGAYQLLASYRYHPQGTLFICVVDPGVGTDRKIIYVEAGGLRFIAPDNGLLSWVFEHEKPSLIVDISKIDDLDDVSHTFHGRDVMAPAAGRIIRGTPPEKLGPPIQDYVRLPFPEVQKTGAMWVGEVLAIDTYGNVVTNFHSAEVLKTKGASKLWFESENGKARARGLSETYGMGEPGKVLAVQGSSGFVELAVPGGNAARMAELKEKDRVTLYFRT